jgi:hypothetical protein
MQLEDAERLRKKWGDKPCDHSHIQKEYYLATQTGETNVCTTCGRTVDEETERRFFSQKVPQFEAKQILKCSCRTAYCDAPQHSGRDQCPATSEAKAEWGQTRVDGTTQWPLPNGWTGSHNEQYCPDCSPH